ncbi:hypothetical protein Acr_00g0057180 [Actinidia rufa]|uniref:Transposase (putative) gypsy type domain-containing protein n=1 Tax=Actinidia rufa TaxID=165716 RepID=A0A7J0DN08_9ERIC|nr:hypothetical protein Acr_00g0057180 [Actinidia rufa]
MSHIPDVVNSGDQDSLPSWISDHLRERSSYMTEEVNQSPASPMEGSSALETNTLAAIHPLVEEKTNIMTLKELNALRETYYFPSRVRVRLPEEGETIISACPSEVAFYEAAFPVGLRFPIHPTIRLILQFYNICPAQLVPNAWRSIACSMVMWRARNKKTLVGGYPSNVKGWKSKFFFVSGDEWEFPEGSSREGAPRVPKTWGFQHYNDPPQLYGDEPKVFEEIFRSVEKTGRFSVPVLLELKSFRRVFVSPGSMASRTVGEGRPSGEAPSSSGDVGESRPSHEQVRRQSPSRDDSIECLGSIRTELRRILPHISDLTLLRWSGGKVLDPILNRFMNPPSSSSSSNLTSKSYSDLSLPVKLESDAMSKRISFKKLGEKLGKSANVSSETLAPVKGVVIGEKHARESLASSPSKKGKVDDGSKGKGVDREPEAKKKATSLRKAPTTLATTSSCPGKVGGPVVELKEALDKAKESAIEEFKSSSEFMVAVEDFASKYFGEGFDFCKVQLRRHHPDLAIRS